jgi:hypothetical protein
VEQFGATVVEAAELSHLAQPRWRRSRAAAAPQSRHWAEAPGWVAASCSDNNPVETTRGGAGSGGNGLVWRRTKMECVWRENGRGKEGKEKETSNF